MQARICDAMSKQILAVFEKKPTQNFLFKDEEFEAVGLSLKREVDKIFGRSLAIRELDTGSDNSTEIELVNLTAPHYDVERFGVTFVASPRHADVLIVTGAMTLNMVTAAKKTYDAIPNPKFVVAVGDDACGLGILNDSYAVLGGAEKLFDVDLKIAGNPPSPKDILKGILTLTKKIREQRNST
jgi:Ni,Fe-hydrogenase III small subunit